MVRKPFRWLAGAPGWIFLRFFASGLGFLGQNQLVVATGDWGTFWELNF